MKIALGLILLLFLVNLYQCSELSEAASDITDARDDETQAKVAKNLCLGTLDTQSNSIRDWYARAEAVKEEAESAMNSAKQEVNRQAQIIEDLRRRPAATCEEVRLKMEGDALNVQVSF